MSILTMFPSIILLFGGLFWCYGLISANAPSLKDDLDKIIPYQGFVGILLLCLWLWDLFHVWRIFKLLEVKPLFGVLALITLLTKLCLWAVLSFWLITKYVLTPTDQNKERSETIYKFLIYTQVPCGILAFLLGIIGIIVTLF